MAWYEIIAIVSLSCLGVRVVTDEGSLLFPLRQGLLNSIVPFEIQKPILICVKCMASLWGTVIFLLIKSYSYKDPDIYTLFQWLFTIFSCSFINAFMWSAYEKIKYL